MNEPLLDKDELERSLSQIVNHWSASAFPDPDRLVAEISDYVLSVCIFGTETMKDKTP